MLAKVVDGFGAIEKPHRMMFDESIRNTFADSIALDDAIRTGHETENRWDYLLGHAPSMTIVAVEPHSAKEEEISTVIRKRSAAKEQLKVHLKPNAHISSWLWVASGKVHFADTETARRRLDSHGIEFVGRTVLAKHLPQSTVGRRNQLFKSPVVLEPKDKHQPAALLR